MQTLAWSRDGDQYVANGTMGEYRITPWIVRAERDFQLTVTRKSDGARKTVGGFMALVNAKSAAETYDNYRAVAS